MLVIELAKERAKETGEDFELVLAAFLQEEAAKQQIDPTDKDKKNQMVPYNIESHQRSRSDQ